MAQPGKQTWVAVRSTAPSSQAPKMNSQIYDPEGDLTFVLTTKAPREGDHSPFMLSKRNTTATSSGPAHGYCTIVAYNPQLSPRKSVFDGPTLIPDSKHDSHNLSNGQLTNVSRLQNPMQDEKISMLVSSKHMSLASPVFKAMLKHTFAEGDSLHRDGKVDVPLPDDEPVAFAILMRILHAQNDLVPTEINLQTLTDVAILVDKYRLHACASAFASLWITPLKPLIPQTRLDKDILSWICITWVFRKDVEFDMITSIAQMYHAALPFRSGLDDLPIPAKVISFIKAKREKALREAFTELEGLVNGLEGLRHGLSPSPRPHCPKGNDDCEAMLLGSLLRSAASQGIWPIPQVPYNLISTAELVRRLRMFRIRSLCRINLVRSDRSALAATTLDAEHGVTETISDMIDVLEDSYQGLSLKDFE